MQGRAQGLAPPWGSGTEPRRAGPEKGKRDEQKVAMRVVLPSGENADSARKISRTSMRREWGRVPFVPFAKQGSDRLTSSSE